jgi:hypothetical protein
MRTTKTGERRKTDVSSDHERALADGKNLKRGK